MKRSTLRGILGILACVLLTACSSKAERIESRLQKSADFVRLAEWDKASVEVRNVLQIDPKNADAYFIAGQIDDGRAAIRNAYANYSKAIELRSGFVAAKIGLARVFLLSGDVSRAESLIAEVRASEPGNTSGRALGIALAARQGRTSEALDQAAKLVASDGKLTTDSSLLLAGLYVNAKDHNAALSVLDKGIAADSANVKLLQMAAEVSADRDAGQAVSGRAVDYFKAAVRAAPKNDGLWKTWSVFHIRRNEFGQAESVLREAIRIRPDEVSRTLALLEFSMSFRDLAATEKEFANAVSARPKEPSLRFALASFYSSQSRPDDARRTLNEIVALGKDAPAGLMARGQLAALNLTAGRAEEARAALAEILKSNPRDAAALLLRGRIAIADGKQRDAIIDLRAAAKDRPGSAEIAMLLSSAHKAVGEPQLAREVVEDAVKFKPDDAQLRLLLASELATGADYRAALGEVTTAVRLAPANPRAQEMKVELLQASGDAAGAEREALEFQRRFPDSPFGFLQLGRIHAMQKRIGAAMQQYDLAARLAPTSTEPVLAAVSLAASQRDFANADKRIDAFQALQPRSAVPHELRAELALAKGDLAAAEASFKQVAGIEPVSVSAYKNLASVMVARKNLVGALAVLDDGEKKHPNDVVLPSARAEWLARAGRTDEAVAVYGKVLERAPNSDTAANNLAYILTQAKGDKASLDRALQLANRFDGSTNPAFAGTLGLVRYRLGQYDQAAAVLERAVALAPNEAILQLHYGMALYKKGDVQNARVFLRKAFDSKVSMPNLAEARTMMAQG